MMNRCRDGPGEYGGSGYPSVTMAASAMCSAVVLVLCRFCRYPSATLPRPAFTTGEVAGDPPGGVSGETGNVERTLGLRGGGGDDWLLRPESGAATVGETGWEFEWAAQSTRSVDEEETAVSPVAAMLWVGRGLSSTSAGDSGYCAFHPTCPS